MLAFQYDALDRMTAKFVPERSGLAAVHTRDVYYAYDLRGLQTRARFDSLSGEGIANVYDGFGRLVSSTIDMGGAVRTVSNAFDPNGNRIRMGHPDGAYFLYRQDGLDRPIAVLEEGGAWITNYGYDQAGRRSALSWDASLYAYDPVGRLKTLSHNLSGTGGDQVLGFTYNPANQILTRSGSNDDFAWKGSVSAVRPYSANGQNQYTQAGPATFGYDPNGNLASTVNAPWSTAYVYDVENRLVSASGTHNAELVYDPLGRLFQVSSGSGVRRLVYDGDALIAEYDGGGAMAHRFVHGNDEGDDPLVWYDNFAQGWRRTLLKDHQGSAIAISDLSGNLFHVNRYDEFGIPDAANKGRFGYTGQTWIPELGLWYYKARIFSPYLGRFLQTDPIGYDDQINLYAYVGNDPINGTDPSGQATVYHLPDGSVRVVQTFHLDTSKASTPVTENQISQVSTTLLSGQSSSGTNVAVVVQVGHDSDSIRVRVKTKIDSTSPDPKKRAHTNAIGGRKVSIGTNTTPTGIAHEIGHGLGAGDQYKGGIDAKGKKLGQEVPGPSNLMRDQSGASVNGRSIDEILASSKNTHVNCVASPSKC